MTRRLARLAVTVIAVWLLSGCGAMRYLCPSGVDVRSVEAVANIETPEIRTLARMSVCGLPITVETIARDGVATVCVDAPILGVRCKQVVQ